MRTSDLQATVDIERARKIVLSVADPLAFCTGLIRWDGATDELVLVPASMSPVAVQGLLRDAGEYRGFTDRPELLAVGGWEAWRESSEVLTVADGWATTWLIPTSGTTREPRLIPHLLPGLTRSVKSPRGSGCTMQWGLLYDPARFAGLQVVFQALLGGGALSVGRSDPPLDDLLAHFVSSRVNAMSATPSLWRKLLAAPAAAGLDLRWATLGGEAADQSILDAVARRWPHATVTHIYASTEAGVGFSVKDGLEGFPASFLESGVRDVQMRINGEGCLELRRCEGSWLDTGDVVELRGERVYFLGRSDGAINVGGDKVRPEQVERAIRELTEVVEVKVSGHRNSLLGQVVAADVVWADSDDDAVAKRRILDHCRARLRPVEVPATVRFVERLSLTDAGKVSRS